jgi:hypothetical protein
MHTVKELPANTSLDERYRTPGHTMYAIVDENGDVLKSAGIYHIYDDLATAENTARQFNDNLADRQRFA